MNAKKLCVLLIFSSILIVEKCRLCTFFCVHYIYIDAQNIEIKLTKGKRGLQSKLQKEKLWERKERKREVVCVVFIM